MSLCDLDQELQLSLPLAQGFAVESLRDPGPKQVALPRGPRFRSTKPKAKDCMDEDGTHVFSQPEKYK